MVNHNEALWQKFQSWKEETSKCAQLTEDQSRMYLQAVSTELIGGEVGDEGKVKIEAFFSSQVLLKRISAFNLPIRFTHLGLLAAAAITSMVPGRVVVLLIDALNNYEGREVTAAMIGDLYPLGFYKEEFTGEVIDAMKNRLIKWSQIY